MRRQAGILASSFLLAASLCSAQSKPADQVFKNPGNYLPTAQSVLSTRHYNPASLNEIPSNEKIYVLGKDDYSRAAFSEIMATVADPSLKGLSLDNPEHSFAFPYKGACFVKLTEPSTDKKKFISVWSGIPEEFIENDSISLDGEGLGMALHEIRHCSQPHGTPVAAGENEADMQFIPAQALSSEKDLVRETMYLRALLMLNRGISQSDGKHFGVIPSYYVAALSFDSVLRGEKTPPDPQLASEAYAGLQNNLAFLLSWQAQKGSGFKEETPDFARVAMAVNAFIAVVKAEPTGDPHEKTALRAAELYMEGLKYYLPEFSRSLDQKYGHIDVQKFMAPTPP